MKAIVIGATSAVGQDLVKTLLYDDRYETVTPLPAVPWVSPIRKSNHLSLISTFLTPGIIWCRGMSFSPPWVRP